MTVLNEAFKDRAHGLSSTVNLKILRRDYLIKIPGVPLYTQIIKSKNADNVNLAEAICTGLRGLTSGL